MIQTRIFCTNLLSYLGLIGKPIHLLGLGNPIELRYQRLRHNFVFRADSSAAYDCGSQGLKFERYGGYARKIRKLEFGSRLAGLAIGVSLHLESIVKHNMEMVNEYAGIS